MKHKEAQVDSAVLIGESYERSLVWVQGPWSKTWTEYNEKEDRYIIFTSGRKQVYRSTNK